MNDGKLATYDTDWMYFVESMETLRSPPLSDFEVLHIIFLKKHFPHAYGALRYDKTAYIIDSRGVPLCGVPKGMYKWLPEEKKIIFDEIELGDEWRGIFNDICGKREATI